MLLLAVVWIFSMSGVDKNAYSAFPVTMAVGVVALLIVAGVCMGYKLVRMSWLGWFSLLGVGGYYMARCCMSYSVVEVWREGALILGAMVFYLMGLYAAQLRSNGWLYGVLLLSVALNILYSYLMNDTDAPMVLTGRPEIGLTGLNTRPGSLFLYCNVGAAFLMLGGVLLLNIAFWLKKWRVVYVVMGLISIVLSFYYDARIVYVLPPILLVGSWLIQFLVRLYEKQKIGRIWGISGVLLFVSVGCLICEFLFGYELFGHVMEVDTHLRSRMWKDAIAVALVAPEWGYGASATQWEILPIFDYADAAPVYAHNEYVQMWVDYGVIGLILMCMTIVFHVGFGAWAITTEHMNQDQRKQRLLACLIIVVLCVCAFSDFFWHFYSMVAMTAFCCGITASPFARDKISLPWSRKWVVKTGGKTNIALRTQGICGNVVIVLMCVGMIGCAWWLCEKLYYPWLKQWEFAALCVPGKDDDAAQRHLIQEDVLNVYPDAAIMDYFYSIPLSGVSWQRQEVALKKALAANPKNLFVVTMLGDVLCWEKKHREAEILYRKYFSQCTLRNAMHPRGVRRWHAYYAYNLLRWGYQKMKLGDPSTAYSMMDYALNIHAKNRIRFFYRYGSLSKGWNDRDAVHPEAPAFIRLCEKKVELFQLLGIRKNDSWKEPLEEGAPAALYQEWGHTPRRIPSKKKKRKSGKK